MRLISTFFVLLTPHLDYLHLQILGNGNARPCVYFAWVSTFLWRHWFDCDRICDGGLCCANVMNQGDPDCDFNSHQIQPLSVVETLLRLSDSVWIRSELSAHIDSALQTVGCWRSCSTVNLQYHYHCRPVLIEEVSSEISNQSHPSIPLISLWAFKLVYTEAF